MSRPGTLPPSAPVAWQNCTRTFPGQLDQIRQVRALLADFLGGFPAADDAILLISELATNACTHSASGGRGGTFTVRARLAGRYLHAEIEDQGSEWDGRLAPAEAPHGLYLLRALSDACGTLPGDSGWITWFTLGPQASTEGDPTEMTKDGNDRALHSRSVAAVAQRITARLRDHGFGVQTREWEEVQNLTIAGIRRARSCLTVADNGYLRWDYQPRSGPRTSPAALAGIVMRILEAPSADDRARDEAAYRAFRLKGAVGRLLEEHGLTVGLLTYEDLECFDVLADVSITNPARPGRGTVRVNDNGDLEWECHAQDAFGGDAVELVAVLAPVLRKGARPGPRPTDPGAVLDDLEHHWGNRYELLAPGGLWVARRIDNGRSLTAGSPQELHRLIGADHAAHPAEHHCILTDPIPVPPGTKPRGDC